jgi:peptidoglycan hydrolase-like protein with peptidoglycan-binding domain
MKAKRAQRILIKCGWPLKADGKLGPVTRSAIKDFQMGWAFGKKIRSSGKLNPRTVAALKKAEKRGGACSKHFFYREWKSKGNGWIRVNRVLVRGLETYRARFGATAIISGYRDWNYHVELYHRMGQAPTTQSQHLDGDAADIPGTATLGQVKTLQVFSGIGIRSGKVVHVDVRHAGNGPNTTGGTPTNPTVWNY